MRLAVFLIIAALALCALMVPENRPPNAGLPVVHSALKDFPKDHMLFAPCPLGPGNQPTKGRPDA